jgi:cytochrome P450
MYAASLDTVRNFFFSFVILLGTSDYCMQTITFTQHLFLAMLEHPEYLKRAHAELDGVLGLGPARLPTFEDRPRLPFLDALFSETMRWGVPVPLGASP